MKQIILFFITLIILSSCHHTSGSGNIVSEKRTVENFKGISVGGDFEVEVKIGPVTEVTVEADDNVIEYIETNISGNTLRIRTEDMHNFSNTHMKVYITVPALSGIKASASADVRVIGLLTSSEKLSFQASSSGSIDAEVDAPEIETDASSGGSVTIRGKTKNHEADASSGADIKTWDLLSEQTNVSVSSGANAKVHASIGLKVTASSGATVTYHGAAAVTNNVSSGASVQKKE